MGTLLDRAILAVKELPPAEQDEIALLVLAITGEEGSTAVLTEAEIASLEPSLAQAERREYAGDEDVAAVWRKHRL